MRDLYKNLFRARGIMPDVVARQNPRLLFEMLDSIENEQIEENLPPSLGWLKGL